MSCACCEHANAGGVQVGDITDDSTHQQDVDNIANAFVLARLEALAHGMEFLCKLVAHGECCDALWSVKTKGGDIDRRNELEVGGRLSNSQLDVDRCRGPAAILDAGGEP